jgi:hypothetical protein
MKVVVATHGHCFDGLASAAVFTQLLKEQAGSGLEFCYHACGYGIGQKTATPDLFTGDENAILDYRLTACERLTWYFDHHRTAFPSDVERSFYQARAGQGRFFYDSAYSSCTKMIYEIGKAQFGLQRDMDELVKWADVIDTAGFSSAAEAIDRSNPVMQLVTVTEHYGNDGFVAGMVSHLLNRPLVEVAKLPEVQRRYKPLRKRHEHFVKSVEKRAVTDGDVVLVDLTERSIDLIGKFVTYALFPEQRYSVIVVRLKRGFKISVGYNPWCGLPLNTDISAICARFGGGGHAVVGGISVADGQRDRAREIANSIVQELNG